MISPSLRLAARAASLLALLGAGAFLPGCLEFEKQTVLVRREPGTDALRVRIIYEGLYSTIEGEDVGEDFVTLGKIAKGEPGFALLDPILFFRLTDPDSKVEAILAKHAKLENGAFFRNAEKKLSAWQDLRVAKAADFVAALNGALNDEIARGGLDEESDVDAETKKLMKAAAAAKRAWIVLDDTGLRLDLVASPADAARWKEKFLRGFAEGVIEAATSDLAEARSAAGAMLRTVSRNPLSWSHRGTELTVGLPADAATRTVRFEWWNVARYRPNLLEPAKPGGKKPPKLPARIDGAATVEKLADELARAKK